MAKEKKSNYMVIFILFIGVVNVVAGMWLGKNIPTLNAIGWGLFLFTIEAIFFIFPLWNRIIVRDN